MSYQQIPLNLLLAASLGLLMTGCSLRSSESKSRIPEPSIAVTTNTQPAQKITPTEVEPIFIFPTQEPNLALPNALIRGRLVNSGSCLWIINIESDANYAIIWPPGYTWREAGDIIEVIDRSENVVARSGNVIVLGGGPGTTLNASDDGCPPKRSGWVVLEPVTLLEDGSNLATPDLVDSEHFGPLR